MGALPVIWTQAHIASLDSCHIIIKLDFVKNVNDFKTAKYHKLLKISIS